MVESKSMLRQISPQFFNTQDFQVALFVASPDGQCIEVNEAACDLLEYTKEELLRMSIDHLCPPNGKYQASNGFEKLKDKGFCFNEIDMISKSGKKVVGEVYGSVLPDGNYLATVHNITARKEMEQKLKEQLTFAQELNRLAELIISTENMQNIFNAATKIIGKTMEMDHCMIFDVCFPEKKLNIKCQYEKNNMTSFLASDKLFELNIHTGSKTFVHNLNQKQLCVSYPDKINPIFRDTGMADIIHTECKIDSFFWYPFTVRPKDHYCIAFDQMTGKRELKENELEFLYSALKLVEIAIQKDQYFSERKRIEETLRKAEQQKDLILSSISELVVLHDENMRVKWVNATAEDLETRSKGNAIGHHCYQIWQGLNNPCPHCPVVETLQTGEKHRSDMAMKDGQIWNIKAFPVFGEDGKVIGAVEIGKDITAKKRMEEEMSRFERLNLIGEMAAGFGHEIRNPMTTVRGFLQMLCGKEDCTAYRGHFEMMIEEIDRANSIITEFLSMAKHKPVDLKLHNLNSIIASLFPLMHADAMHSDKTIELELHDIPHLLIDKKETHQLILNIVRNGLEAMESGGYLTIRTYAEQDEVVLAVQDQGTGIQPELMSQLGIPFVTTKENGTGLGLAICYSIVQRHQARIDVESSPEGTTFFIRYQIPK